MRIVVYEHYSRPGARDAGAHRLLFRAGRAMREAVSRDLATLPGTRLVPLPAGEAGQAGRMLDRALQRADAALVIGPEDGGLLERLAAAPARAGVLSLGPGPVAVRTGADKIATARVLRSAGVPFPADRPRWQGDPVVFKPRRGCGAEGVVVVRRRADRIRAARIAARAARGDGVVTQAFVPGIPLSASFLVRAGGDGGRSGDLLCLGLGRQRLRGRFRLAYAGGEIPGTIPRAAARRVEEVARAAVAALARTAPDLRGFVGVDLVLGPRGPVVIEINPRLTSSYLGLSRMAGGRIARFMIAAARGERLPERLRTSGHWRFLASGSVRRTA